MPIIKFESDWLKAGDNVKQGDAIRFLDSGHQDENGQWIFKVGIVRNGVVLDKAKKFSLNKKNYKAIAEAYGEDSDAWLGKEMRVNIVQVENPKSGTMVSAVRLASLTSTGTPDEEEAAGDEPPF